LLGYSELAGFHFSGVGDTCIRYLQQLLCATHME
jgi:hypothetical protein